MLMSPHRFPAQWLQLCWFSSTCITNYALFIDCPQSTVETKTYQESLVDECSEGVESREWVSHNFLSWIHVRAIAHREFVYHVCIRRCDRLWSISAQKLGWLPYQNTGKTTVRQIIVPFHSVPFLSHFINDSNNSSKSQFMIVTTHRMFISCWVFKNHLILYYHRVTLLQAVTSVKYEWNNGIRLVYLHDRCGFEPSLDCHSLLSWGCSDMVVFPRNWQYNIHTDQSTNTHLWNVESCLTMYHTRSFCSAIVLKVISSTDLLTDKQINETKEMIPLTYDFVSQAAAFAT